MPLYVPLLLAPFIWCCQPNPVVASLTYTAKVGPATAWIRNEGRHEVQARCADSGPPVQRKSLANANSRNSRNTNRDWPHTRIVNGSGAELNMFPYAAAFTNDPTGGSRRAYCGATLISRQHLITAAHCAELYYHHRAFVLIGGVCIQHSSKDACTDQRELLRPTEIDFILTSYFYFSPRDDPVNSRGWENSCLNSPDSC